MGIGRHWEKLWSSHNRRALLLRELRSFLVSSDVQHGAMAVVRALVSTRARQCQNSEVLYKTGCQASEGPKAPRRRLKCWPPKSWETDRALLTCLLPTYPTILSGSFWSIPWPPAPVPAIESVASYPLLGCPSHVGDAS